MPTCKYALVIGNSEYHNEKPHLPGVINDCDHTRRLLQSLDFKVLSFINLKRAETFKAVKTFTDYIMEGAYGIPSPPLLQCLFVETLWLIQGFLSSAILAFIYVMGHGFAEGGTQYLMPYDAAHSPSSADCISIRRIVVDVLKRKPALCFIVKELCHQAWCVAVSLIAHFITTFQLCCCFCCCSFSVKTRTLAASRRLTECWSFQ